MECTEYMFDIQLNQKISLKGITYFEALPIFVCEQRSTLFTKRYAADV